MVNSWQGIYIEEEASLYSDNLIRGNSIDTHLDSNSHWVMIWETIEGAKHC